MEISKFNVIHLDSEKALILNTLTSAMVKLSPEEWNIIECGEFNNVPNEIIAQLKSMGIISDYYEDQITSYKYKFYKAVFEEKRPFLYIAPTMRCNFECFYCFEQGNKQQGLMSEDTALRIIQFLKGHNKQNISIVWFGGEPMLGFDRIVYICSQLKKEGIAYTSSMITNGSLFTETNINELSNLNLKFIQFSMDGVYNTHDKRRCFIGGKPSFSIVINNLKRILDTTEVPIVIQITMDHQNPNAYEEMMEFCSDNFSQYLENGRLQIGFNNVQNRTGFDIAGNCFTCEELVSADISRIRNQDKSMLRIPGLSNPCMFRTSWYYAIDPQGNLYKCIEQLGNPSERVGSLKDDVIDRYRIAMSAFQEDPFSDSQCLDCSVFPICGGGCPLDRIKKARGESREICSKYKEGLGKMLPHIYEKLKTN